MQRIESKYYFLKPRKSNNKIPFSYFFRMENGAKAIASGYLLVDPELRVGKNGEELPIDCIQCHTVLAKCLGPFSTWENKLLVSKNSGYNMIHFTPIQVILFFNLHLFFFLKVVLFEFFSINFRLKKIFIQELGASRSSYSLSDQLKLNSAFSSGDKETTFDDVEALAKKMRSEWNVSFFSSKNIYLLLNKEMTI